MSIKSSPLKTTIKKGGTLKDRLKGKGLAALQLLAPELEDAIAAFDGDNPINPGLKHVPCPVHGGTDGFRLFDDVEDSGGGICNTCGPFADAQRLLGWLYAYREHGAIPSDFSVTELQNRYIVAARDELWHFVKTGKALNPDMADRPVRLAKTISDEERAAKKAKELEMRTWTMNFAAKLYKSASRNDPHISAYFAARGIHNVAVPNIMAYHAGTPYYAKKGDEPQFFPTILMPVVVGPLERAKAKALHRIYLQVHSDGRVTKAPLENAKKILSWGDYTGAAIRLYPLGDSTLLVLAEGPETAVAVHTLTGLPTWSCINAGNMEVAEIPDEVDTVLIAEDFDVSKRGQQAAAKLADRVRAMGKLAIIVSPKSLYQPQNPAHKKGIDWDDAIKIDRNHSYRLWEPYLGYGRKVPQLGSLQDEIGAY